MYKRAAKLQVSLTSDCPVDLVYIGIVFYWHAMPLLLLATHEALLRWLYCCAAAIVRADSSARTSLHLQYQDNNA
jgi:hypothetical protein